LEGRRSARNSHSASFDHVRRPETFRTAIATADILFRNNAGDTWVEQITNGAFAGWNQIGGSSTSFSVLRQ
jgi:hypothetical protein